MKSWVYKCQWNIHMKLRCILSGLCAAGTDLPFSDDVCYELVSSQRRQEFNAKQLSPT